MIYEANRYCPCTATGRLPNNHAYRPERTDYMESRWYWLGSFGARQTVVQYNSIYLSSYLPVNLHSSISIILYPANIVSSRHSRAWQVHLYFLSESLSHPGGFLSWWLQNCPNKFIRLWVLGFSMILAGSDPIKMFEIFCSFILLFWFFFRRKEFRNRIRRSGVFIDINPTL